MRILFRQNFIRSRGAGKASRAFTIIEILVVVAVIITLIAILAPTINAVQKNAQKAAATMQLGSIKLGLQAYFAEFNMYPPSSPGYGGIPTGRGDIMLAQGLMGFLPGPDDGAGRVSGSPQFDSDPQFGFRMRRMSTAMGGGNIYGPYVAADKGLKAIPNTNQFHFVDAFGHPVLYYRSLHADPKAAATLPRPSVIFFHSNPVNPPHYFFDTADCGKIPNPAYEPNRVTPPNSATQPSYMTQPENVTHGGAAYPGFYSLINGAGTNNISGVVTGSTGFILISAGPDEVYFTGDDAVLGN